jgi:hypothetical protein
MPTHKTAMWQRHALASAIALASLSLHATPSLAAETTITTPTTEQIQLESDDTLNVNPDGRIDTTDLSAVVVGADNPIISNAGAITSATAAGGHLTAIGYYAAVGLSGSLTNAPLSRPPSLARMPAPMASELCPTR